MLHEDGAERFAVAAVCAVNSAVGNGHSDQVEALPRGARRRADRVRTELRAARRQSNGARPIFSNASRCTKTHVPALRVAAGANAADSTNRRDCGACLVERIGLFAEALRRRVQPRCRACAQVLP